MQKTVLASTSTSGSIPVPAITARSDSDHAATRHKTRSSFFWMSFRLQRHQLIALLLLSTTLHGYSAVVKSGCRKHGTQYVIDEPGCDLVAVSVNMCSGYCMSFSFVNPEDGSITVHGRCCRMVDNEWVKAVVTCEGGERIMKIPSATECRCFDCA